MNENMNLRKAAKQSTILSVLNGATIALVFLIIGSFFMSVVSSNRVARLYKEEMELTDAAQGYVDASGDLTDEARNCAATGSITSYNNYMTEVNVDKNREKNYDLMMEIGLTSSEIAMIDQMSSISNNLVPLEENAMNSALAGDTQSAVAYVFGSEYSSNLDKIHSLQDQFRSAISSRMAEEIQAANDQMNAMQICVFCFTVLAVLFQVFSIIFTRKRVIRPLKEVVVVLQKLAGGNLSVECTVPEDTSELGLLSHYTAALCHQFRDYIDDIQHNLSQMAQGNLNVNSTLEYLGDFKQIKNSIEQISVSLIDTLSEIDIAANEVASGADQMSNGAQALSQGATQQASATEELTSTVTEINQALIDASQAAIKARETANESGHTANLCNDQMKELVSAMNDISNTTEQVNKIIKEIDDIAFQTNILALNAAVEAARAGSAGKGFAVVADEVRNLAGKSAESAKNTAQLIEACLTAVDRGANLVHATADRLQVVSNNSSEMAEMVKDIADTAQRSSDSVQQVSVGLDQISAVVQTNSATSEESAATSEELSAQAGMLKQLLSKFQFNTKEVWQ